FRSCHAPSRLRAAHRTRSALHRAGGFAGRETRTERARLRLRTSRCSRSRRAHHGRRQPDGGAGGNASAKLELAGPLGIGRFSHPVHQFSFAAEQALSLSSPFAIANRSGPAATQLHLYAARCSRLAAGAAGPAQPANAHRPAHIAPYGAARCPATFAWTKGAGARGARYAH